MKSNATKRTFETIFHCFASAMMATDYVLGESQTAEKEVDIFTIKIIMEK